jgi:hypothetical protein
MLLRKLIVATILATGALFSITTSAYAIPLPVNTKVLYEASKGSVASATVSWDGVPGAVTYNIYTIGSKDTLYATSETNSYSFSFDKTSNWYFRVTSVGKDGSESSASQTITVAYPSAGASLATPSDIKITQVETINEGNVKNVHVMWNSVVGVNSYKVYSVAGDNYEYLADTTTNLYEMRVPMDATFYVAVSAVKETMESARSETLTIDLPKYEEQISPTPTITPVPTSLPPQEASNSATVSAQADNKTVLQSSLVEQFVSFLTSLIAAR